MFPEMFHTLCGKSPRLSWSHYIELMRVPSDSARAWYHEHAASEGWSVRTLSRNISTQYYYRIAWNQSPDNNNLDTPGSDAENEAERLAFIKNPLVLEFLNIPKDEKVSESDLETMILNNLLSFLLGLACLQFCLLSFQLLTVIAYLLCNSHIFFQTLAIVIIHLLCVLRLVQDIGQILAGKKQGRPCGVSAILVQILNSVFQSLILLCLILLCLCQLLLCLLDLCLLVRNVCFQRQ